MEPLQARLEHLRAKKLWQKAVTGRRRETARGLTSEFFCRPSLDEKVLPTSSRTSSGRTLQDMLWRSAATFIRLRQQDSLTPLLSERPAYPFRVTHFNPNSWHSTPWPRVPALDTSVSSMEAKTHAGR